MESHRKRHGNTTSNRSPGIEDDVYRVHECLVPFPGLFHAKKQAMYSIFKEILDGLGLDEIVACAGLFKGQVSNILTHSHALNNRAVLFNFACAMIIHITDMLLLENRELARQVASMHKNASEKNSPSTGY